MCSIGSRTVLILPNQINIVFWILIVFLGYQQLLLFGILYDYNLLFSILQLLFVNIHVSHGRIMRNKKKMYLLLTWKLIATQMLFIHTFFVFRFSFFVFNFILFYFLICVSLCTRPTLVNAINSMFLWHPSGYTIHRTPYTVYIKLILI